MLELRVCVPTYNLSAYPDDVKAGAKAEFGDPCVPVVVREANGIRVVLGSHDYWDGNAPDIQIERRPHGWVVFLHPLGGCDPSGLVYFLEDGRSFVVPERNLGSTPAIVALDPNADVTEVDCPNDDHDADEDDKCCELCDGPHGDREDSWDGLCPECADLVSLYLERRGLTDEDRDATVAFLKAGPSE